MRDSQDFLYAKAFLPIAIIALSLPIAGRLIPELYPLQSVAWQPLNTKVVYHLSLHIITLVLGSFLLVISGKAFLRDGRRRLLMLTSAFTLITLRETVNIVDLVIFRGGQVLPFTDIELAHLMDFLIIALFSAGTLKS